MTSKMIEPLLLCATQISTFLAGSLITTATGFFFTRDDDLYLVTSRHVLVDEKTKHFPDEILIKFHVDRNNVTRTIDYVIPLYINREPQWVSGRDSGGDIDVAVIKVDKDNLPAHAVYESFDPENLTAQDIEIGTSMLIVGFPLGFYDTLHTLPVVRSAINASSFALRFQGNGYFLTDARTHSGSSGAPVICRNAGQIDSQKQWVLLGIHSARFDTDSRDTILDERLGLNCAWFADILLTLTEHECNLKSV